LRVLFSNPPWWGEAKAYADTASGRRFLRYTAGVRAGSRWPFTFMLPTPPRLHQHTNLQPYPFFMGYATTYVAKHHRRGRDLQGQHRAARVLRPLLRVSSAGKIRLHSDRVGVAELGPTTCRVITEIKRLLPETRIVVTGPITSMGKTLLETAPIHACAARRIREGRD